MHSAILTGSRPQAACYRACSKPIGTDMAFIATGRTRAFVAAALPKRMAPPCAHSHTTRSGVANTAVCLTSGAAHQQQQEQQPCLLEHGWARLCRGAASLSLAFLAVTGSSFNSSALAADAASPLYDSANVVARDLRGPLTDSLEQLEKDSGWKVRVYTAFGGPGLKKGSAVATPRELWGPPDAHTLWLVVDPSSPNILNMVYIGDDVLLKLRRPFLQEVQARYGNLFFVRDQGESAAVQQAVGALTGCLAAPEGCKVVPGLPSDQYAFTLAFAVAGGLIAGFVSRIPAQGIVSRQWVWLLIFSPLWASLFINFGLGPVVSRTSDLAPVMGNCAGFIAAAAVTYLDKLLPAVQPKQDS